MEYYLTLKLIHILAAVVVTGTGMGIAFFMFMANRSNTPQAIYVTAQHVILGDWLFTTPAVITQIITGILLMNLQGYSFNSPWFYWVLGLLAYFSFNSPWFYWVLGLLAFIGICWLPVLRIQYKLRALAKASVDSNNVLPEFKSLMRTWTLLGIPAFTAILVIFWLMVFKPFPVA